MPVAGTADNRTIELLWRPHPAPAPSTRPALSLPAIASAAIAIADADGLGAVSMQRVAGDLGYTKMALYRYVASKAELIAVMIENAVGDPPELASIPGGWRPRLQEWARQLRATWQRHPWLPWATRGDRLMGPHEIGWTECAVAALADTRLSGAEQIDTVFLLSGHIRNTHSTAAVGTQPWTAERQLDPRLAKLLHEDHDRFPALIAATDGAAVAADSTWEFGLRCLLDSIELLIAKRAARRPAVARHQGQP